MGAVPLSLFVIRFARRTIAMKNWAVQCFDQNLHNLQREQVTANVREDVAYLDIEVRRHACTASFPKVYMNICNENV